MEEYGAQSAKQAKRVKPGRVLARVKYAHFGSTPAAPRGIAAAKSIAALYNATNRC